MIHFHAVCVFLARYCMDKLIAADIPLVKTMTDGVQIRGESDSVDIAGETHAKMPANP